MYESISKSGGDRTCSLCVVGQIIVHIPDSSKCSESILMRMIDRSSEAATPHHPTAHCSPPPPLSTPSMDHFIRAVCWFLTTPGAVSRPNRSIGRTIESTLLASLPISNESWQQVRVRRSLCAHDCVLGDATPGFSPLDNGGNVESSVGIRWHHKPVPVKNVRFGSVNRIKGLHYVPWLL